MKNIEKLKSEFYRIKNLNYVKNTRPKNKDGGIGNTFEDLLGVEENNKKEADFEGVEIKSQRYLNKSYISLFTKSPDYPNRANTYLREKYGEVRDLIASSKLQNLFLVFAEIKKEDNVDYCHFSKASIFYDFSFSKFLEQIEKGNIQFDIRIGVHNSGKNYGKTHDHGSGFRIKKEFFNTLYSSYEEIE